jgi:hypothetical protein
VSAVESRSDLDAVQAAELSLLSSAVRHDRGKLDQLLHPEFREIGRSGRVWTREEIIAALSAERDRPEPDADEWAFTRLSDDLVHVTYRLTAPTGTSRHSSIWDVAGRSPRIRFHQGTPLPRD